MPKKLARVRNALVATTVLLVVVTLPHVLEDFQYGDLLRLGVHQPQGVGILLFAYSLQLVGILLTLGGKRSGALVLAAMGAIWCLGAIVVHGHDVLFGGASYRHGVISRILELLIIVLGGLCAVLGAMASRQSTAVRDDH